MWNVVIILGINRLLRSASKRAHERRRSSPAENRALLHVCLFARFFYLFIVMCSVFGLI